MSSPGPATSYWCYSCSRFVSVCPGDAIACPDCNGGFLEEAGNPPPAASSSIRRRLLSTALGDESFPTERRVEVGSRRSRRTSLGDRSPFNPVIVLRGSNTEGGADAEVPRSNDGSSFEFFYDDGAGSGLRPLPQSMSDFLMGSGFDRLLDQLLQIEGVGVGGGRSYGKSPASKEAIESLPTIMITPNHIAMDSHCAICTEAFKLGSDVREMPCKHIFNQDCIFPWLSLRNSCPVCRHELPSDVVRSGADVTGQALMSGEENSGLTIWRLPGGGFAVGRFSGGRQDGERELPVVYTEMDGSFNSGGARRRISWSSRRNRSREHRRISRIILSFFSIFGCVSPSNSVSSSRRRLSSASQSPHGGWRTTTSRRFWRDNSWSYEEGSRNEVVRW